MSVRSAGEPGSAKTTIILVRHGVTDWNQVRRFQGQIDIPLNEEGRRQAELTGRRFSSEATHPPIAAVLSSDLSRAVQTAQPIATALGLELELEPLLRERHYGAFQGLRPDEIVREYGQAWERWRAREPDFELPGGGESLRGFHARVERALLGIAERHPGAAVVAVAHGGVLDCAFRIAAGMPLDAPRGHELLNASLNRIACEGGRFELLDWADVRHLGQALDDLAPATA
jgi:probable phosphoglycerate mutase